jgi:hypothetical protein
MPLPPIRALPRFRPLAASALLATALLTTGTGCPAVGVIADKLAGPRPIEAMYEPGKTTQLLVIAENFRAQGHSASDNDRLARLVSDQLAAKEVSMMVSQEKLAVVRDARPGAYGKMSVVDVGRAVGAQQVLYIDFGGIGVGAQQGSNMLKGVGHATVKVIDVAAGQVTFPRDMSEGMPIGFETPIRRATDVSDADAVRRETLLGLSSRISRLFFKYQPTDIEAIDSGR